MVKKKAKKSVKKKSFFRKNKNLILMMSFITIIVIGFIASLMVIRYGYWSGSYPYGSIVESGGCDSSSDCNYYEYCSGGSCYQLGSPRECEYIENHARNRYTCCSDSECSDGNSGTADSCINPETLSARCENKCYSDSGCKNNEKCLNNKCVDLTCGECQYAANNQCYDYECCDDYECSDGNSNTIDSCINPSTTSSYCSHSQTSECSVNSDCSDGNACTTDSCYGSPRKCYYSDVFICQSNDGCCPGGCDYTNDNDCSSPAINLQLSTENFKTYEVNEQFSGRYVLTNKGPIIKTFTMVHAEKTDCNPPYKSYMSTSVSIIPAGTVSNPYEYSHGLMAFKIIDKVNCAGRYVSTHFEDEGLFTYYVNTYSCDDVESLGLVCESSLPSWNKEQIEDELIPVTSVQDSFSVVSTPQGIIDCGTVTSPESMDCFITASETCAPAKIYWIFEMNLFGILFTQTTYMELEGWESTRCVYYQRVHAISIEYSDALIQSLLGQGLTMQEIEDMEQQSNEDAQESVGIEKRCTFIQSDLTAMLIRWESGQFSTSDWDNAICD